MAKYIHKGNYPKPITFSIIREAAMGDVIAINRIIEHYSRYIAKLSTKRVFDGDGNTYEMLDEDMKRQLETKLITEILKFKLV